MFQQVQLIGRMGKDPEQKTFEGGDTLTNISIATSKKWKDQQGNKQEQTEWHEVVVKGGQQNFVNMYLKKGDIIQVIGELKSRVKADQNGKNIKYWSVTAQRVNPISTGRSDENQNQTVSHADQGYMPQAQPVQQQHIHQAQPVQHHVQQVPQAPSGPPAAPQAPVHHQATTNQQYSPQGAVMHQAPQAQPHPVQYSPQGQPPAQSQPTQYTNGADTTGMTPIGEDGIPF